MNLIEALHPELDKHAVVSWLGYPRQSVWDPVPAGLSYRQDPSPKVYCLNVTWIPISGIDAFVRMSLWLLCPGSIRKIY